MNYHSYIKGLIEMKKQVDSSQQGPDRDRCLNYLLGYIDALEHIV